MRTKVDSAPFIPLTHIARRFFDCGGQTKFGGALAQITSLAQQTGVLTHARFLAQRTDPRSAPSGIEIPSSLAVAPVADFAPNPWNPNKMDDFMREKLARSIRKDGFLIPVLVRPNPTGATKWEIVDGEHRLVEGRDTLKMSVIPYLNLGPISDARAKAITIKANTLRGEFDSVQLGKMIADMVNEDGFQEIANDLPYTAERLQGLVDLVNVDMNLTAPTGPIAGDDEKDKEPPPGAQEFKSFDPRAGDIGQEIGQKPVYSCNFLKNSIVCRDVRSARFPGAEGLKAFGQVAGHGKISLELLTTCPRQRSAK